MTREQRRLAAIVSVDVVGYSRLMGSDDSGTLARWKALCRELIEPKVTEYGGRVVNTAGDNQLQEFPSVVDAVRCSVDIQRGMAQRNEGQLADCRFDFRIGVSVGDVIDDGVGIFGDDVNIAARLQALAPPGGICTSKPVRDQVIDKLSFTFENFGAHTVKNITRPIEVYRLDFGAALPPPRPLRLALAILPFATAGSDPEVEQLAEELTRGVTSAFANMARMMQVVSRELAASYEGKRVDPRKVGRELDASYLVEGEVRRVDERIEVNVQLIEAASATQLWSQSLEIAQVPATKERAVLVSQLSDGIQNSAKIATMRRFAGPPAPHASPLELTWHGYSVWNLDNNTMRGALEARKWFDQALRVDPNFIRAMTGRWATLESELDLYAKADRSRILHEMDELSFRAISIDSSDPYSWFNRAATLVRQQRWEAALEANAKAEKHASVTVGWVLSQRAEIMMLMGQPQQAVLLIDRQLAVGPQNQAELGEAMIQRGRAFLALGRYEDAIAALEKGIALADSWFPHLCLVAAYALTSEAARAAAEKAAVLQLRSGTSIADLKKLVWSENPTFVQQTETHLLAGLRKAGFPEE